MIEEIKNKIAEYYKDYIKNIPKIPKGWVSIEDHLPVFLTKDVIKGKSTYLVMGRDGNIFKSTVLNSKWYYLAKETNITHWYNE